MLMMVEKLVMKKKVFSKLRLLGGKILCVKYVVAFLSLTCPGVPFLAWSYYGDVLR